MAGVQRITGSKVKKIAEGVGYRYKPRENPTEEVTHYGSHKMRETNKPRKSKVWLDIQADPERHKRDVARAAFFGNIMRAAAPHHVPKIRAIEKCKRYLSEKLPKLEHFGHEDFEQKILALGPQQLEQLAYLVALLKGNGDVDLNLTNIARSNGKFVLFDFDWHGCYWQLNQSELENAIILDRSDQDQKVDNTYIHNAMSVRRGQRPRKWLGHRGIEKMGTYHVFDHPEVVSPLYQPDITQDPINQRAQFKAFVTMVIQASHADWLISSAEAYLGDEVTVADKLSLVKNHQEQMADNLAGLYASSLFRRDFVANFEEYKTHIEETCCAYNQSYSERYTQSGLLFDLNGINEQMETILRQCTAPPIEEAMTLPRAFAIYQATLQMGSLPTPEFTQGLIRKFSEFMDELGNSTADLRKVFAFLASVDYALLVRFNENEQVASVIQSCDALDAYCKGRLAQKVGSYKRYFAHLEGARYSPIKADVQNNIASIEPLRDLLESAGQNEQLLSELDQVERSVSRVRKKYCLDPIQAALTSPMALDGFIQHISSLPRLGLEMTAELADEIQTFFEGVIGRILNGFTPFAPDLIPKVATAINAYQRVAPLSSALVEVKYRAEVIAQCLQLKGQYRLCGYTPKTAKKLGKFPKSAARLIDALAQPIRAGDSPITSAIPLVAAELVDSKLKSTCFRRASVAEAYGAIGRIEQVTVFVEPVFPALSADSASIASVPSR